MKKMSKKSLSLHGETVRILTDLRGVHGGKKHSDDPCWTTRTSDGLPCTDEPSTKLPPPPPTQTK